MTPGPAYRIRDLDEGLEPVTDYAINGIGNALVGLSFIDVVAAEDRTLEAPVTSRFVTGDGLVITAEAEKQAKLYYARFRAGTPVVFEAGLIHVDRSEPPHHTRHSLRGLWHPPLAAFPQEFPQTVL